RDWRPAETRRPTLIVGCSCFLLPSPVISVAVVAPYSNHPVDLCPELWPNATACLIGAVEASLDITGRQHHPDQGLGLQQHRVDRLNLFSEGSLPTFPAADRPVSRFKRRSASAVD